MNNILQNIRIYFRSKADRLDFSYFIEICKNYSINDIKNTIKRIKYRGDHNETHLIDEKLLNIYNYIFNFNINNKLNEEMNIFLELLVKHQTIMNIVSLLQKLNLLFVSDIIIKLIMESVENNLKESLKAYMKLLFSLIYRAKMTPVILEMFYEIVRKILNRSIELNHSECVKYILILLGYNEKNMNKDFEIFNIDLFGIGEHTNTEVYWYKFNVQWYDDKFEDTPQFFIHEYVKSKSIKLDERIQKTDDRYFPIIDSIKYEDIVETYFKTSSNNIIPNLINYKSKKFNTL